MKYDQANLSRLNFRSLSNYDKIMFVFARRFNSIDHREQAFEYVTALRNNNQEKIKEFERYGSDPHRIMYNKCNCDYYEIQPNEIQFNDFGYAERFKSIQKTFEYGQLKLEL